MPNPQENGTYWWRVRATPGQRALDAVVERTQLHGRSAADRERSAAGRQRRTRSRTSCSTGTPVSGAISYDIRVSPDDSFNTIDRHARDRAPATRRRPRTTTTSTGGRCAPGTSTARPRSGTRSRSGPSSGTGPRLRDLCTRADEVRPTAGRRRPLLPVDARPRRRRATGSTVGNDPNFSTRTYDHLLHDRDHLHPRATSSPLATSACRQAAPTYWRVQALDGAQPPQVNGIYSQICAASSTTPVPVTQIISAERTPPWTCPTLTWEASRDAETYGQPKDALVSNVGGSQIDTYSMSLDARRAPAARSHQGSLHLDGPGGRRERHRSPADVRRVDLLT